jgi:hypothetical protein
MDSLELPRAVVNSTAPIQVHAYRYIRNKNGTRHLGPLDCCPSEGYIPTFYYPSMLPSIHNLT